MKGKIFIDTNILIYAHDLDAGGKNEISLNSFFPDTGGFVMLENIFHEYLEVWHGQR